MYLPKIDIFYGLPDAENTPWDTDLVFPKKETLI